MEIIPKLRVTDFDSLDPGSLFMSERGDENTIYLKVKLDESPASGSANLAVSLQPPFPTDYDGPRIWVVGENPTVVNFGRDYQIVLPTDPTLWQTALNLDHPGLKTTPCMIVTGSACYLRVNGARGGAGFEQRLVSLPDGTAYVRPQTNLVAAALAWEIHA